MKKSSCCMTVFDFLEFNRHIFEILVSINIFGAYPNRIPNKNTFPMKDFPEKVEPQFFW